MKHTLRTLLAATLIFGTTAASHAEVLLRIDARDPSQVFFHATTNASSIDTSGTRSFYGFTLIDFLTGSDRRGITGGSGNLISTASRGGVGPMTLPYNGVWTADYESGQYGAGNDLNIMVDPWPSQFAQIFNAGGQAFSGTMTIDLSGIASLLPTEGATGNIRSGNGVDASSAAFGTYEVIPEPGTSALVLVGLGAVLFAGARRMRKKGEPTGLIRPIRLMKLMKTTLLTLFALALAPFAHALSVTATGDVTPFPSPNPLPNDWLVGGPLTIGDTGTGSLLLEDYVGVYSTVGRIGNEAGSDGTLTVNSSSYWESSSDLFIGRAGTGKMVIGQYASVGTVNTSVADQAGSTGTVEINGWGATWENTGDFYVGRGGTASLTVGFIASLETQSLYTAMSNLHGVGDIYAKGVVLDFSTPGDKLIFDSTHPTTQTLTFDGGGNLHLDINGTGALGVGFRGTGEMQIREGSKVSSSVGYLGMMAGSDATGTVTGAGSEWNIATGLYAGQEGRATLFIGSGGKVSSAWGSIDAGVGSSSSVYVTGAGSVWTNANQLVVGEKGPARLQAMNGGRVASATGVIGSLTDSHGQVFIQGTNSTWTMTGDLKVGNGGQGDLNIESGGVVSNAVGYVGAASGGNGGSVIVTGTGSQWNNSGGVYIGDVAYGQLDVIDGGRVTSVFGSIGDETTGLGHATISGADAVWTNTSWLAIGERGIGTLTVQNGGRVESGSGLIGNQTTGTGAVTVNGTNSTWNVAGSLYVGKDGTGNLTVTNGGNVTAKTLYTAMTNLQGNGTISANGLVFDTTGEIIIDGNYTNTFGNGGTLNLDMDGTGVFGAGYKNFGSARIRDGAVVRSTAGYLGLNPGSRGWVDLNGAGTAWLVSGDLHVGNNVNGGYSQLMIWNGAKVSAASVSINSQWSNTPSQVYVDGTTSVWTNSGTLTVGESGHGAFKVFDATATSGAAVLGKDANSSGRALVHGSTGRWDINGTLTVGENGTGTLTITNGGTVNVTGALTANAQSTIRIGASSSLTSASATTAGELLVDGAFQAGTTIQSGGSVGGDGTITGNLTLLSGAKFTFSLTSTLTVTGTVSMDSSFGIASLLGLDDTVDEGTYTLIDGTATDFSALDLQNWGYDNRYQISGQGDPYKAAYFKSGSLQVEVIPEPGTSALLLLGLGAALFAMARRGREK